MAVTTSSLVKRIETLLVSTDSLDDRIEQLKIYTKDFDGWYALLLEQGSTENSDDINHLLDLHNELIKVATEWLKDVGYALGAHKKKGKVIMAYADILPKKISRYKPKKG